MHELSLALNIPDVVAEEAERRGGVRVLGIYLKLGPLAGVVKEAILSAYEIARVGSSLEGAELVIEEVPVMAPGHGQRRPAAGARPGADPADYHRHGLPPRGRDDRECAGRLGAGRPGFPVH